MDIESVLNRRSDLSTFVVHFTKDTRRATARENLESILTGCLIEARNPMGWVKKVPKEELRECQVVCFSETPLEHAYSLTQEISGRQVRLAPYGLAFSKEVARRKGANPVWYVDMTPGQDARWAIASALDGLRDSAVSSKNGFAHHPAARVLPFIEQMGTWTESQKEFWWEREWRHRGNFAFSLADVTAVFCPEAEIEEFEEFDWPALDSEWSLEKMIAKLAWANERARQQRREQRRYRLNPPPEEEPA